MIASTLRPHRRAQIACVALTALLASAGAVHAQGRWHVDLQAGAFIPTCDIEFRDDGIPYEIDPEVGGAFSAGGGYALDRWVDFTAQFLTGTHFDVYDEAVNVYSFTVGGRFFPLPMSERVRPWVGTQIGWYRVDGYADEFDPFDDDDSIHEGDDSFGLNAGGGLDIVVNHRVSLGVDVRYHNAFDAFQGYQFVSTMFNVSIWFGGAAERAALDTPPVPRSY